MSKRSRGHQRRQMIEWFPDKDYRDALVAFNRSVVRGSPDFYVHLELERMRGPKPTGTWTAGAGAVTLTGGSFTEGGSADL